MDKFRFGNYIYQKRKDLGLKQDDLGKILGVTNKAVSKWETGETLPDICLLEPLAKALNVSVDELLTQEKPKIEYKKNPYTKFFILSIIILLVIILIFIISIINLKKVKVDDVTLNSTNFFEYYDVLEANEVYNDNQLIKLKYKITPKTDYVIEDFSLLISYRIDYNYNNTSNRLSTITYIKEDLLVNIEDGYFYIEEKPKNTLTDYVDFNSYKINISYNPKAIIRDVVI